jgi:hypothetical protein
VRPRVGRRSFRPLTMKQFDARQTRRDREREHTRAAEAKAREERKQRYDEQPANARLRLLECQSIPDHEIEEVAPLRDGTGCHACSPLAATKRSSNPTRASPDAAAGSGDPHGTRTLRSRPRH